MSRAENAHESNCWYGFIYITLLGLILQHHKFYIQKNLHESSSRNRKRAWIRYFLYGSTGSKKIAKCPNIMRSPFKMLTDRNYCLNNWRVSYETHLAVGLQLLFVFSTNNWKVVHLRKIIYQDDAYFTPAPSFLSSCAWLEVFMPSSPVYYSYRYPWLKITFKTRMSQSRFLSRWMADDVMLYFFVLLLYRRRYNGM